MSLGIDHLQLRKQLYKNLAPYPHPDAFKRFFDKLMIVVGTLAPLALLPQIYQVFVHHDVAGLSILTWISLGIINSLWAIYGILHRELPIFVANFGMGFLDFCIVFGILFYH